MLERRAGGAGAGGWRETGVRFAAADGGHYGYAIIFARFDSWRSRRNARTFEGGRRADNKILDFPFANERKEPGWN